MEMLDDCFDEHYKIYEGIKNQNADAAVEALRRHTMNSKMLLL
jgi:DNA-binding GntR family transcriptional regulator